MFFYLFLQIYIKLFNNINIFDIILVKVIIKMNKIKKYYKYILLIMLYFLCEEHFIIFFMNDLGIKYSTLPFSIKNLLLITEALIYVCLVILLFKKEIKNGIKDLKENFNDRAYLSIKCWAIGFIIMGISSLILSFVLKKSLSGNESIIRENIQKAPVYMIISCCFLAPLFEELIFRKMLSVIIKNKYLFIVLSGFIFGALHVIGTSESMIEYLYIIPYGAMGSSFAYLLSKTDNIALPIAVHMLHNSILILKQIIGGLLWKKGN